MFNRNNQLLSLKEKSILVLKSKSSNLKVSSIKVSYIFNALISVFNIIIPFITAPYIARVLTSTGVGTFNYAQSLTSYFNLVVNFGFASYTTYSISRSRDDLNKSSKTFTEVFFAKIFLLCFVISLFLTLTFFNIFGEDRTLLSIISLTIFATGIDVSFLLKGFEKFKQISIITCSLKLLNLILIFVFIKGEDDLLLYFIFEACLMLLQSIIIFIQAKKYIFFQRVSLKNIFYQYKKAFKFFVPEIAVYLYTVIDITMIGAISTKEEVAYYSSASRIIVIVNAVINAICPVLLSRISYLFKKKEYNKSIQTISKVLALSFLIEIPAVAGVLLISHLFIPTYFGPGYEKAIPCLYVLSPLMIIVNTGSIIVNSYFIPSGKRNTSTVIAFIAAGINCTINYFLISKYGALGAAISSLIAESIVTVLNIYISRHFINYREILSKTVKIICSTLIMSITILLLNIFLQDKISNLSLLLLDVCSGVAIYFTSLLIFKDSSLFYLLNMIKNKLRQKKL